MGVGVAISVTLCVLRHLPYIKVRDWAVIRRFMIDNVSPLRHQELYDLLLK